MNTRVDAARVLIPSKMAEAKTIKANYHRLKAISNRMKEKDRPFPYTEENLDTILTMFLYYMLRHDLPMMIYWMAVAEELYEDVERINRTDRRFNHQAKRLLKIAERYDQKIVVIVKEIQDLYETVLRG